VLDTGGIPEDLQEFQENMVFTLNPLEIEIEEDKEEDSMWPSASSRDLDWFLTDE